jgi:hypothetical protein
MTHQRARLRGVLSFGIYPRLPDSACAVTARILCGCELGVRAPIERPQQKALCGGVVGP